MIILYNIVLLLNMTHSFWLWSLEWQLFPYKQEMIAENFFHQFSEFSAKSNHHVLQND